VADPAGHADEERISIEGWMDPPGPREIERWAGEILEIGIDPPRREGWIPIGEFLRLARVIRAERRPWWRREVCPRCHARRPRFRLHVEWESGYGEPGPQAVICEACTFGRVVHGREHVTFGGDELGELKVSWSVDLRP
jgi:hypothetical protein